MEPCTEIEKKALMWRLAGAGLTGAVELDAPLEKLFREASSLLHGKPLGSESPPKNLANVFNVFGEEQTPPCYFPAVVESDANASLSYPVSAEEMPTSDPRAAADYWQREMERKSWSERSMNDLLRLTEITAGSLPSAADMPDVSLCVDAKLTASLAACLHEYIRETGLPSTQEVPDDAPAFYLVSGDLSGIQPFIYTIPSAGALKSLRGRSFYLDVLLENLADEILASCGLSRSCLLYTGGGHFYLLLPAIESVEARLASFEAEVNQWFLEHLGSRLYLALGWAKGTKAEIRGAAKGGTGILYRRVSEIITQKKLRRYSTQQLQAMFTPESDVNKVRDKSRECGVCHTSASAADLKPYPPEGEKGTMACKMCRNLYAIGAAMLKGDGFLISGEKREDALPLPGQGRTLYLTAIPEGETPDTESCVRIYWKNQIYREEGPAACLWLGDYVTRNNGQVIEFEALAEESGGETGIDRLGVLRADVDNLGAAFIAGFPEEYATLARSATLSRQLSVFFKRYMNDLCRGRLAPGQEPFSLLEAKKPANRKVHIVYSGGDDLFFVGAWDDLIELTVDIHRAFQRFTNGKLTFSAGLGFFKPGVPIATMARETGRLEDAAKDNPGKDSIALFGTPAATSSGDTEAEKPQRYHWQEFIDQVCGEKLAFLRDHFSKVAQDGDESKLSTGMSGFYRILELLREDESIHLARFAYALARLDPGSGAKAGAYQAVRDTFYDWYKKQDDRRQLRTALELAVYRLRKKD